MKTRLALNAALIVATSLIACSGGGQTPAPPPAAAPSAAPATTTAAPAATTAAAGTSEFGVPECDDYMAKYLACIDSKVPEAARAVARQGLDQTKASWKQAASTPQGKQGLATACKQATDAAKTSMAAYGCTW